MFQLLVTLGFIDQLFTKEKKELKIIYFCPNFLYAYFEDRCQPNIMFILFYKTKYAHPEYLARISGFACPNTFGRHDVRSLSRPVRLWIKEYGCYLFKYFLNNGMKIFDSL